MIKYLKNKLHEWIHGKPMLNTEQYNAPFLLDLKKNKKYVFDVQLAVKQIDQFESIPFGTTVHFFEYNEFGKGTIVGIDIELFSINKTTTFNVAYKISKEDSFVVSSVDSSFVSVNKQSLIDQIVSKSKSS